jgi:hypothetical protein
VTTGVDDTAGNTLSSLYETTNGFTTSPSETFSVVFSESTTTYGSMIADDNYIYFSGRYMDGTSSSSTDGITKYSVNGDLVTTNDNQSIRQIAFNPDNTSEIYGFGQLDNKVKVFSANDLSLIRESSVINPNNSGGDNGIALDSSGNVYLSGYHLSHQIYKYSVDQSFDFTYVSKWGSEGSGQGQFGNPQYSYILNSNLFVVDTQLSADNKKIVKYDLSGNLSKEYTMSDYFSQQYIDNGWSRLYNACGDSKNIYITTFLTILRINITNDSDYKLTSAGWSAPCAVNSTHLFVLTGQTRVTKYSLSYFD